MATCPEPGGGEEGSAQSCHEASNYGREGNELSELSLGAFTASLQIAVQASVLALGAWGKVFWILWLAASRLAVLAWPTVKSHGMRWLQRAAAQPKEAIALEVMGLVLLVLIWRLLRLFRRRRYLSLARAAVQRRLDAVHASVQRRSRMVAAALPHMFYATCCVLASNIAERLGLRHRYLELLLAAQPVLSTALPAARTLLALSGSPGEQELCLRYWVVWAFAGTVWGLLQAVPFASSLSTRVMSPLLRRLPVLLEVPFYAFLWLQVPSRRGLLVAYGALAPELQRRAHTGRTLLPSLPARVTSALELVMATAFGLQTASALAELVHEAATLMFGLIFLLTPTPIAAVGLLLLALGGPMVRSIDALDSGVETASARGVGNGAEGRDAARKGQLRYWLSYAVLCGGLRALQPALRWVPFATHWQLLAVLWLQLPIVRGATRLLGQLVPPILRLRAGASASTTIRTPRANALYSSRLHSAAATTSAPQDSQPQAQAGDGDGETAPTHVQ